MKYNEILKKYSVKAVSNNKLTNFFILISVILAVSISLSIPQISISIEEYWSENAYKMNGADLKVEAIYSSEEFEQKIDSIKKNTDVTTVEVFNTTISKDGKQVYGDLIVGSYELMSNQVILSENLSKVLGVSEGETIYLKEKQYEIKEVEQFPKGVGKQAEEMGYIKVTDCDLGEEEPYSKIIFINDDEYKVIEQELKEVAVGYFYSTVEDIKEKLESKNSTNMLALNMLNTISIIMTVLSILSSILVVVLKSKKDIAVMRLQAISTKTIIKAFQKQFRMILYPAIVIGTVLSVVIAKVLVKNSNLKFALTSGIISNLILGMILFFVIYNICIHMACNIISQIKPLNILRGNQQSINKKKLITKGIGFTVLTLVIYSIYAGGNNILAGSIIIFFLIIIFLIITFVLLNIILMFRPRNKVYKYTFGNMREKRHSMLIIILSLSFTVLFSLVGFTLSSIIANTYTKQLDDNLNYNYMLTVGEPKKVEGILKQDDDTGFYTKLNMRYGTLMIDSRPEDKIILCGVNENQYAVQYNIIEGEDIFEGNLESVIISDELSKKKKVSIDDSVIMEYEGMQLEYKIKGIYNSGGMNTNHVLSSETELDIDRQGIMYLARIPEEVVADLVDVQIVNINNVSNTLEEGLQNIFGIFKGMCAICIALSFIFNINLVYTDMLEQRKNYTVMRAIGISKEQLTKNLVLQMLVTLVLTLFLSVGNYCLIIYYAMRFIFNQANPVTFGMLIIPCGVAILMVSSIFVIPFIEIRKMKGYDDLRELV